MKNLERLPTVICWDLDRTLGIFEKVYYDTVLWECPSPEHNVVARRHGIKDILKEFEDRGYWQFITTSASQDYAAEALKRSGLANFFDLELDIWACDLVVGRNGGKEYSSVADAVYFDDETGLYKQRMIVIGDAPGDQPSDLEGLVFLWDPEGAFHDALIVKYAIDFLLTKGGFKTGFDQLVSQGVETTLPSGVRLHLGYGAKRKNEGIFPTVVVKADDKFDKPLEIIEHGNA